MILLNSLGDAMGRVLQSVVRGENGQLVLLFEGDTYVALSVNRGWEAGDETIAEGPIVCDDFGDKQLARIYGQEPVTRWLAERNEERRRNIQERERAQYERLKKIYGADDK